MTGSWITVKHGKHGFGSVRMIVLGRVCVTTERAFVWRDMRGSSAKRRFPTSSLSVPTAVPLPTRLVMFMLQTLRTTLNSSNMDLVCLLSYFLFPLLPILFFFSPHFFKTVCDEIIDCDNWADEEEDCSPSIVSGIIAFSVVISLSIVLVLVSLVFIWVKRERGRVRAAGVEFLTQLHIGTVWGMSRYFSFLFKTPLFSFCFLLFVLFPFLFSFPL